MKVIDSATAGFTLDANGGITAPSNYVMTTTLLNGVKTNAWQQGQPVSEIVDANGTPIPAAQITAAGGAAAYLAANSKTATTKIIGFTFYSSDGTMKPVQYSVIGPDGKSVTYTTTNPFGAGVNTGSALVVTPDTVVPVVPEGTQAPTGTIVGHSTFDTAVTPETPTGFAAAGTFSGSSFAGATVPMPSAPAPSLIPGGGYVPGATGAGGSSDWLTPDQVAAGATQSQLPSAPKQGTGNLLGALVPPILGSTQAAGPTSPTIRLPNLSSDLLHIGPPAPTIVGPTMPTVGAPGPAIGGGPGGESSSLPTPTPSAGRRPRAI